MGFAAWFDTLLFGYARVFNKGSELFRRNTLNFTGDLVEASDDSGNQRTEVKIDSALVGAAHPPVVAVAHSNIANLGAADVAADFDGKTVVEGDRVLLPNQGDATENGVYIVGAVSSGEAALTRAADFDTAGDMIAGSTFYVQEGTLYEQSVWTFVTTGTIVVGTTNLEFISEGGTGKVYVVDSGSASISKGDWVASAATDDSGLLVTKADAAALAAAGAGLGVALHDAAPDAAIRVAPYGDMVAPGVTGLGAVQGPVRINPSTARSQQRTRWMPGDYPAGYADHEGNLTVVPATMVGNVELEDYLNATGDTITGATDYFFRLPPHRINSSSTGTKSINIAKADLMPDPDGAVDDDYVARVEFLVLARCGAASLNGWQKRRARLTVLGGTPGVNLGSLDETPDNAMGAPIDSGTMTITVNGTAGWTLSVDQSYAVEVHWSFELSGRVYFDDTL